MNTNEIAAPSQLRRITETPPTATAPVKVLTPYFPDEITQLILNKLPIKSLLRFKLVSKPWFQCISSDNFIMIYNALSSRNLRFLVVDEVVCSMFSLLCDDDTDSVKDIDVLLCKESPSTFPEVVAVANGLVALTLHPDFECAIWNPSTNRLKVIPENGFPGIAFGLGYSSLRNDYFLICGNAVDTDYKSYSVKHNLWESIEYPRDFGPLTTVGLYEADVLYWDKRDVAGAVIEFDLNLNVFYQIRSGCGNFRGGLPIIAIRKAWLGHLVLRSDGHTSEIWRADHGLRLTDPETVWTCLNKLPTETYGTAYGFLNDRSLITRLNRQLAVLRLTGDGGNLGDAVMADSSGFVKAFQYHECFVDFIDSRVAFITAKLPPDQSFDKVTRSR